MIPPRWEGRPSAVRGHLGGGLVAAATSTGWLHVWQREGLRWARVIRWAGILSKIAKYTKVGK